jgi:hypothetical protein
MFPPASETMRFLGQSKESKGDSCHPVYPMANLSFLGFFDDSDGAVGTILAERERERERERETQAYII